MLDPELQRVMDSMTERAYIKPDDIVLVLTDPEREALARIFANSTRKIGAETMLFVMEEQDEHGNEPPTAVAEAMKLVDFVMAITTTATSHTDAIREAREAGVRTGGPRGLTRNILLSGGVDTDYNKLEEKTKRVRDRINNATTAHVSSNFGTDVEFGLDENQAFSSDGSNEEDDLKVSLGVSGEAAIAPTEGSANGKIVFDFSMDNMGILAEPIELTLSDGFVTEIDGGDEADELKRIVENADENANNLAEFAIGTNPDAQLIGNLQTDKRVEGTSHFAIGDNKSLGGTKFSTIHLDGMITKPTITLDDEIVVDNGELLIK